MSEGDLVDKLFALILDSIMKKPGTALEASSLVSYVIAKDVMPLLARLRAWAVAELVKEEGVLAARLMAEVKVIEKRFGC